MLSDSKEKLRIAILKILNSNNLRIFGCIIYNFDIKIISNEEIYGINDEDIKYLTANVKVINNKALITIYEKFIETKTINQLIFVILHEMLHVIFGHHLRLIEKNLEITGLAADHVINSALIKDINKNVIDKVEIPEDAFFIPKICNDNLTFEEVYEYLNKNGEVSPNKYIIVNINNESVNIKTSNTTINNHNQEVILDIIPINQENKQETHQIVNSLISELRSIINNNVIKGNTSGETFELIKKMVEIEIPWTTLLDRAICSKIVPSEDNRTWSRIQKRPHAHGFIFPGIDNDERPSELIIVEDQSGSIDDSEIEKFASVIFQSLKYFDSVRIIKHDVKIHSDEKIEALNVVTNDILFKTFGRGGTSHKHVFDKIEEYSMDDESDISLVIMLTDFDSDIEKIWNDYEWTKLIPISIVLVGRTNIPKYIDPRPIYIK